jgi:type I restriction enzyme S subunit
MEINRLPFTELLNEIIDNRGKTCPTVDFGIPLIATNCIRNDLLYPTYDKVRYVSQETYKSWFRGHPKPGDLILVLKGTPGRVCLVPDPIDFCMRKTWLQLGWMIKKFTLNIYLRFYDQMKFKT